ncbi:MAG TPA: hypothetical protein DEF06_10360, partial [Clostridiales bacterium]|nr:hypothetical protein [Clostridiales bacterium]
KNGLGRKAWISAATGPREVGVLFLYLEKSRQEKPLGMGRSVRFYLRTWLEVKTEEHQSGICLAGTVQRPFFTKLVPFSKNICVSENPPFT